MSEKRYIHIRNWDTFQHRDTTRNQKSAAPWIKDYVGQLHDDDWLSLTCAQRGLLQGLRLMYAATRGRPLSEHVAARLLAASSEEKRRFGRNLERLNHAGFIEFSDSNLRAELPASRAQPARPDVDVDVDVDVEQEKEHTNQSTEANNDTNGRLTDQELDPDQINELLELAALKDMDAA